MKNKSVLAYRHRRDIEWLADGTARNILVARIAGEDGISIREAQDQLKEAEKVLVDAIEQDTTATTAVVIAQLSRIISENLSKNPSLALKAIAERNKLLGLYSPEKVQQHSEITIHTVVDDQSL